MTAYDVIKKPRLSEKSYAMMENKKYVFIVDPRATKTEIRNAVEEIFEGVLVDKVNVVSAKGKLTRVRKSMGYTSDYKKAYVTLKKESKTIAFFDSLS